MAAIHHSPVMLCCCASRCTAATEITMNNYCLSKNHFTVINIRQCNSITVWCEDWIITTNIILPFKKKLNTLILCKGLARNIQCNRLINLGIYNITKLFLDFNLYVVKQSRWSQFLVSLFLRTINLYTLIVNSVDMSPFAIWTHDIRRGLFPWTQITHPKL